MPLSTDRISKKIDMVFVLALITLFAATSLSLVLIGAKQYRHITNTISENHEERTISSYLAEKIRQHDTLDAITVCDLKGVPALSIVSTADDVCYITYIYYYDNALRELVVTGTSVFSLSSGQAIMAIQKFEPELVGTSLIRAEITDIHGETQILYFALQSDVGKEDV